MFDIHPVYKDWSVCLLILTLNVLQGIMDPAPNVMSQVVNCRQLPAIQHMMPYEDTCDKRRHPFTWVMVSPQITTHGAAWRTHCVHRGTMTPMHRWPLPKYPEGTAGEQRSPNSASQLPVRPEATTTRSTQSQKLHPCMYE